MLYLVGTPIGNLGDISLRALEVLKSVDKIACEDTRHSLSLLNHFEIKKPLLSYHKFNERESGQKIIAELKSGKNIALITDAGMPVISDPGNILVKMLIEEGLDFTVIPGACAFVSALVLSGVDSSKFCFLGFLPKANGEKKKVLEKYKNLDMPLVFYCSPHDIEKDVQAIYETFGERRAVAVKEITKIHEKAKEFNLSQGIGEQVKGEYVLIVEKSEQNLADTLTEQELYNIYLSQGLDKKEALKKVAKEKGVSKSSLYKLSIEN